MKIPTARLKQIIKEELFYRDFYREDQEPEETQKAIDKRAKMVHEIRDMGDDLLREMIEAGIVDYGEEFKNLWKKDHGIYPKLIKRN